MPFINGIYQPPGLPVYPPQPNAVISSSYFTQLMQDMFNALSLTFLRDGSVPFTGDFNIGGNNLKALANGSASAPSVSFSNETTSGLFLNGAGRLALAVSGVKALELTPKTINAPIALPVPLTDAATVTPDGTTGLNFYLLLTSAVGNSRTLANFANPNIGSSGLIFIQQDSTGSRTITWGSNYKAQGGIANFVLSSAANAMDVFSYFVYSSTYTLICPIRNPS